MGLRALPAVNRARIRRRGHGPCVIFMTGARLREHGVRYSRSELALRYGAGVEQETTKPAGAYAPFPRWEPIRPDFGGLPWG
jgi:hypothetical protein